MPEDICMRGWGEMASSLAILLCGLSLMGMALETSVPRDTPTLHTASTKVFTYPQPPPGFDPLSASGAELAKYGFPPRPDPRRAPALYERWRRMVSMPRPANPTLRSTNIYNGPARQAPATEAR
jgi:hypothetical protein